MCNSGRRHFLGMSLVVLGAVGLATGALAAETEKPKGKVYVCPPCGCAADGKEFPEPGACPECGMPLVEKAPAPKLGALSRPARPQGGWRHEGQMAEVDRRPDRAPGERAT